MPASEARILANQANSKKSTGPTTSEGKERSRGNAVKHGLCSKVIGIEDPEAVRDRAEALAGSLSSAGSFEGWLASQIATITLQIDRSQAMQQAALERISLRADLVWEDDRRLDAILLGDQLASQPGAILERLGQTPQGCEWMITRWAMLARAASQPGGWNLEQSSMAFDLLGTPFAFRQGVEPGTDIDLDGNLTGPVDSPATLARRQIAELQERIELTSELDAADRQRAESGLSDDAELKRLRRYEADLHRRLRWMVQMLQGPQAVEPKPAPNPEATPEPATLEVPTPAGAVPQPPRSTTRTEKKLRKADARREARLRKLEESRA